MAPDQHSTAKEIEGLQVTATGLNKHIRPGLNILQDISLVFQPNEFIVIVGQSGGGKSTLLDALSGYRPATDGQVSVNQVDVYNNFDAVAVGVPKLPSRSSVAPAAQHNQSRTPRADHASDG